MPTASKQNDKPRARVIFVLLLLLFFASLIFVPERITRRAGFLLVSTFKSISGSPDEGAAGEGYDAESVGLPPGAIAELGALRIENAEVRRQLILLQSENIELKQRLKLVADLKAQGLSELQSILVAHVIVRRDSSNWRQTVGLDRGSDAGVRAGMPVTVGPFLVGHVDEVDSNVSRAVLVTDARFKIRAMAVPDSSAAAHGSAARAEAERFLGIYEGNPSGHCQLRFIPASAPVRQGWVVVTAEDRDKGMPEGLIIGKVDTVERDGKVCRISVSPYAAREEISSVLLLDIGHP
ncbi:MAG: rod shape-determining protein MreC [Planctomycetota bacterium]|nr:rod shape-determining protein MreC [Planctomycetota bacterium]